MAVTAPPRPPRLGDPVDRKDVEALVEALIEEARRRARRRRRRNGTIGVLVALVAVTVFAVFERAAESQTSSPALAARSSLFGAIDSKIAFTSDVKGGQWNGGLYVANADGSGKRTLSLSAQQTPAWSPDGRRIAFTNGRDLGPVNDDGGVYVVNADGSDEHELSAGSAPSWSPDGRKIAFLETLGAGEISVMNADGSGQRRLTHNNARDLAPVWSPDGRKIAFRSTRDGNWEIYVMNADGSGQHRLTRNTTYDGDAAWSPDGERIAFVSNWHIWVTNADGSGQQRLTQQSGRDHGPSWSRDGRRIVFERRLGRVRQGTCRNCGRTSAYEVRVMNADGSQQRRLVRERMPRFSGLDSHGAEPQWSPDGRTIAFRTAREGNWEIYVMNTDGSGQRNLSRNPTEDDCCLVWSPTQK
jgi:Tol biopolymer transport system component